MLPKKLAMIRFLGFNLGHHELESFLTISMLI